MKNITKKAIGYLFSIVPLGIVFIAINFHVPGGSVFTTNHLHPVLTRSAITNSSVGFGGLPCGFVATGQKQKPEPPTLLTSEFPVLQCPQGGYPGTDKMIPDAVYSRDKKDQLILQSDGNLVIYCVATGKALWSTQTNRKDGKTLFFQTDGDLVLHNSTGKVIWHSNIKSKCAGSELAYFTLQDDGNLAMLYNVKEMNNTNPDPTADPSESKYSIATYYLGGTASTNDQPAMVHPGKIQ